MRCPLLLLTACTRPFLQPIGIAQLLADYLAAHSVLLRGCSGALELGAGLGFAGLLAAKVKKAACSSAWYIGFHAGCMEFGQGVNGACAHKPASTT